MYICPNCNTQSEQFANFCSICGAQMIYAEPQPIEPQPVEPQQTEVLYPPVEQEQVPQFYPPQQPAYPVYTPPVYTPPAYTPVNKPKLATKIVGMALSIAGLVFLAIGGLYTFIFGFVEGIAAFIFALIFDLFYSPLSIVGLCLSNKCINAGDQSAMSRVGRILGIIGIAIAGASLIFGIFSLSMY